MEKKVIYQIFTRVCCNSGGQNIPGGDIRTNGSGKLEYFTPTVLEHIKSMGVTHIWFTDGSYSYLVHRSDSPRIMHQLPQLWHSAVTPGYSERPRRLTLCHT